MTDYLSRAGKVILIVVIVISSVVYVKNQREPIVKLVPVQAPIPSQREIQQRLKDLNDPRYDPNGVDGIIGKDSRAAWDNYTCDKYAKRAIEGE